MPSKHLLLSPQLLTLVTLICGSAQADTASSARPDNHAPIGVMGDHPHSKGEWMFSYRAMRMEMDGNRDGSGNLNTAEVLADFVVAPTRMTMNMQMFGAMYAPSDKLTLIVIAAYLDLEMDHVTRSDAKFTTRSSGFGDIKLSTITTLKKTHHSKLLLNFGISLPTGSNTEQGVTPAGKTRLPYPMQLGSGTYDLMPGLTYLVSQPNYSYGIQAIATIRTGNDQGYRLGNRLDTSIWAAKLLNRSTSISARVSAQAWGDIHGADSKISQTLSPMGMGPFASVPTAQPNLRSGRRLNLALGANYSVQSAAVKGHRLAFEFSTPLIEHLDGPQLETEWSVNFGWQKGY
ncbi:MAG: hypothetical protein JKY89_11995 [Immundisolibacteraceae bacterium]|nr:hypothetical protein [Immundisolibacteraceae bacterium]